MFAELLQAFIDEKRSLGCRYQEDRGFPLSSTTSA